MRQVLLLLVLLMFVGGASGTDYYVSVNGDNTTQGNITHPWQNVSYAAQQVVAGDTVYLFDGTWYDETVNVANSGTLAQPITFTAYNGTPMMIGNTGIDCFYIYQVFDNMNDFIIRDIIIKGYRYGVYGASWSTNTLKNITLSNLTIRDGGTGIFIAEIGTPDYVSNVNITVEDCIVTNFTGCGIYFLPGTNITVRNNRVRDAQYATGIIGIGYQMRNATIENNTVENITTYYGISGACSSKNVIVNNNRINDLQNVVAGRGIRFDSSSTGIEITNNNISNTHGPAINVYFDFSGTIVNNTVRGSLIMENPGCLTVENNTFIDYGLLSFYGYNKDKSDITFRDNIIDGISGVSFSWQNYTTITNNIFKNMGADKGLYFYTGGGDTSETIKITNNVFYNFSMDAIWVSASTVNNLTVKNNIFMNVSGNCVDNDTGVNIVVDYNAVWGCSSPHFDGVTATNTLEQNPEFADLTNADFHLKSGNGRWDGSGWVRDAVTSPCIDTGDPSDGYSNEPLPRGFRRNIGMYGNTAEASKSFGSCYNFSSSIECTITSSNRVMFNRTVTNQDTEVSSGNIMVTTT